MATLQTFIPAMRFPLPPEHEFRKTPTSTSTAPYNPGILQPNQEGRPAFIFHDQSLATRMVESLGIYLQTAPGQHLEPSMILIQTIASLGMSLRNFPLGHEPTTSNFFSQAFIPICHAVEAVDANQTHPEAIVQYTAYNQTPDAVYRPCQDAPPQLHVEFKSWSAFSYHAENILHLGQNSTILELGPTETGHRSIIFKVLGSQSCIAPRHSSSPYHYIDWHIYAVRSN